MVFEIPAALALSVAQPGPTPPDRRTPLHFVLLINGIACLFMGVLLALDALFFPATWRVFLTAGGLTCFVGTALTLVAWDAKGRLKRNHTFLLTATMWLTGAGIGALPLWLWAMTPTDAFFEAMSGITTTGSTVLTGLDEKPHGILWWRAILQWIGGVGFIVTGMALLPILRTGGMQLFRTESSERGEKELHSATSVAAATLWVYVGLTTLCLLVYLVGGMSPFDAVTHAMTTLSTGGYSTHDASFGHFDSAFLQWAGTFFMFCGALPFVWYIRAANRGIFRSEQVRAFAIGLTIVILLLTFWRMVDHDAMPLPALREVAFNVVSVVTTTGFATVDYTLWGPAAQVAFFFLTAIGGCTGSTAGGVKIMRWIILSRSIGSCARQLLHPSGIFPIRYEGRSVKDDVISGVAAFFTFFALTVFGLAVALALIGLDPVTAITGALTAVTNVGPGLGPIIGPAGNFAPLPDLAKWLLSFGMYAGRLEMLTVFVLLTRLFWE
ncbi:TrkH family potassium uptake protein [Limimaricola sp. G21655-S1]|uniref:TrkH family potassium uptake protein n=1 Tax=Limimaricola sp. G21655-S1 TaxID=3014768 RepID=UPI0022AF1EBE|nr:TrkH family potassium uptake protein [Limimaricola sp. G21655-S1]MCZ4262231.1 TrkH family potassium uptake protein [Limimaricola sp. G21655-S1]